MAIIPKFNTINQIMDSGRILQEHRSYLGYSGLGDPCYRKIWYSFRWVKDGYIEPRIQRIFDRGELEEERVLSDLRKKDCFSYHKQSEVIGVTGHVKGHIDAILTGVPIAEITRHLFEGKTMKASSYKKYLNVGLRRYSPTYWQQIHSYMGHLNLTRCLYVVSNKDTEERDYQRIEFDEDAFKEGEKKAFNIITSEYPPERLPNSSYTWHECRFCDYKEICHKEAEVKKSCRTCKNWDIEDKGQFSCSGFSLILNKNEQLSMSMCKEEGYELAEEYK